MEEYTEVFEYDNSEPEDAWWNSETYEYDDTEYDSEYNEISDTPDAPESSIQLGELLETLTGTSNYGTMGDYYNQQLGCYVFPNFEVYGYFIDTDASGAEWTAASDGHYLPVLYMDAYEEYIAVEDTGEPEEYQPTESEVQNLETLESIRGILSVIKENDTAFHGDVLEYYQDMLECQQETLTVMQEISAKEEGILYGTVTECVLTAIMAGSFLAHVFFGRMRTG